MTSIIKERIHDDMKNAMRAQEKERLATIRLIMAAVKQREVDERINLKVGERIELNDEQILATLNKMIKQRRDSINQFEAGNRKDLAQKELNEILVIQQYLPKQLSVEEIEKAVALALEETGATSAKDMGKVMGILKNKLQGKADMTIVSTKVKERLTAS